MYPEPRSHRPLIMGTRGAVGSNHPRATDIGVDVLKAGGNAVDAAVAVSLALGVCEPAMSGLGADGFYHVLDGKTGRSVVYNGTGSAPEAATATRYSSGIPFSGPGAASVPGALGGLAAMHAAHGDQPWGDLVKPAIALAREGVGATHTFCFFANDWPGVKEMLGRDVRSARTFLARRCGDFVRQPELADTLEDIASDGAETFYRGRLAVRLAHGMAEAGVAITERDLASCRPEITDAISVTYRGLEVRQTPPNSTGFTMLQMLKMVERFDVAKLDEAARIHLFVEAKKLAFLDREAFGGDPRFSNAPLGWLLSEECASRLAAQIDMTRAADRSLVKAAPAGDTTYFSVVDSEGNAVSGIQSNGSTFGSGVTAGDTGVLLNNRLAWFQCAPGHPNEVQPGKRPRHTMNCPMVLKNGRLWAVLGTPGADNQVQVNLQIFSLMADGDVDPQVAVEYPRWSSGQIGQGIGAQRQDARLLVEDGFDEEVLRALEERGHSLNRVPPLTGPCSAQVIRALDNGLLMAGSDPRRDGWAGAF